MNYLKGYYDIDNEKFFDLRFIVEELFENAVKYAYDKNETDNSSIIVNIKISESKAYIMIRDFGKGTAEKKVINKNILKKNILDPSGRGLLLIKELSSKMEIVSGKNDGFQVNVTLQL